MKEFKTSLIISGIAVAVSFLMVVAQSFSSGLLGQEGPFKIITEKWELKAVDATRVEVVSCDVFTLYSPTARALSGQRLESSILPEYPNCKAYYVLTVEEFDSGYWRIQSPDRVYVREISSDPELESSLFYSFSSDEYFMPLLISRALWAYFLLTFIWGALLFLGDLENLIKKA